MARISRRNLIAKTGMGAAAVGVLTVSPALVTSKRSASKGATSLTATRAQPPSESIPSVAYVRDAAKGEVVLMVGTREIVRTDPELVAYLSRCRGPATV